MAEPAWKIAMRERKKQKEEEEKKKQAEEEAKLASVPAWKRAMLEKKKGKTGSATTTPASSTATAAAATTTTSHTPTTSEKKWNAATPEPLNAIKPKEASTPTVPSWKLGTSKKVSATKNIFEELQEKANSPQIPKKTPLSPVRESLLEPDKSSSITRRMKEQFETTARTGGVDDHKDVISTQGNDMQDNTGTSPVAAKPFEFPSTPTSTHPSHSVKEEPQKVEKMEPSSPPPPTTTTTVTQNIAKKFTPQRKSGSNAHFVEPPSDSADKMPAWKRELLRRKKGTSTSQSTNDAKSPPPSSPPATSAQSSSTTQATSAAATASQNVASTQKHEDTRTSTTGAAASSVPPKTEVQPLEEKKSDGAPESKKLPEVVNASDKKDESDSPKLVHKEGKTIRAPVLKSKSKWADIKEEDPEFKNLPLWKQELIKRRQNDAKKRTEPIPKEEDKKEEKKAPVTLPSRLMPSEGGSNTSKQESVAKPSHNLTPLKKTPAASTPSSPPPLETSETSGGSNIMNLLQKFGGNPNAIKKRPPPGPAVKENGLEVTLIDEESSDDEAPPTPVMKTSRSGSILKSPEKPVKVIKQNIIQLACMFFQRTTFATL